MTMTLTCEIMKMNDCGRGLHGVRLCGWLISLQGGVCRTLWAGNMLSLAIKKKPIQPIQFSGENTENTTQCD